MNKKQYNILNRICIIICIIAFCICCKWGKDFLDKHKKPEVHGPTETVRIEVCPGHYIDFPKVR